MHLYHLTLARATGIVQAVYGNFSGSKAQEIIVNKGKVLELLSPEENGKIQTILSVEVFGVIRSILPFRLTGGNKDYLVVGSDSGRIVILEYNPNKNCFEKIHQETFGKSGCRRVVAGQYLAIDPKGRAVMIAAIEKQKFVYILNRDTAARLTISSPLEAHRNHTIILSMTGVDVGFDNPIFACLEIDYEDDGLQKVLSFYELDLGLNNVVRKWSDNVDNKSNLLIPVPGGADGPGGVLVCSEDEIVYRNQNAVPVVAPIPRRVTSSDKGALIIAYSSYKQKDNFFFLLQSEFGDLYKVTLLFSEDSVQQINIKYFDTVPVATSLCIMKTGFLFVASEVGNHYFFQIQNTNESESEMNNNSVEWPTFEPHSLRNLILIDELESLCPILDFKVSSLVEEEGSQIYALCGKSSCSSLKVLRYGLAISEMAISPLPGNPSAIWTVRLSAKDPYDKYIVVSFTNATLTLSIGASVEQATDTEIISDTQTIHIANFGEDGIIQVYPSGVRYIRDKRVRDWKTPGKKTIVHATSNERQLVIALTGGDLVYFELDGAGQLVELEKKMLEKEVSCLDIGQVPEGRLRSRFLAVGDYESVRIFSLDPEDRFERLSIQTFQPGNPSSLAILLSETETSYLNIGLNNGVLIRGVLDSTTGEIKDNRTRYLGTRAVKLFKIKIRGSNAILALSARSWLLHFYNGRFQMVPLSYQTLDHASNFASEPCPEGIVSIAGDTLRILTVERLGESFNQTQIPLLHTPRRFIIHPSTKYLIIIETDHNSCSSTEKIQLKPKDEVNDNMEIEGTTSKFSFDRLLTETRPGTGKWASAIRILDITQNKTLDLFELGDNESASCLCTCVFHDKEGEVFLIVGTSKDLILNPRYCTGGYVYVFKLNQGKEFKLVHKTPVEVGPLALCPFQGRLLVGVGNVLRMYELGKKKLLRKCENKNFPNTITSIRTQGDRIYVTDVQESVHYVKFKKDEKQLFIFADETSPRWVTSTELLDYDTVATGDKFGNMAVLRLPSQVSDEIEEDPTGSKFKTDQGILNGASHKLEEIIQFYVGDTITCIQKANFSGTDVLIYSTMLGTIGTFIPFSSREDVDFFTQVEMHLRQENPPLCGRDHLSYRSYYWPVKDVIDGDLCEQFTSLDHNKQASIAKELDRTPNEILKKLEDLRNKVL